MNKRIRQKAVSFTVYVCLTVLLASFLPSFPSTVQAADNGLAQKPYMGWSSYSMQVYSGDGQHWISEATIKQQSDAMHELLQPHGYNYINIDAGWNGGVDEYGRPTPSTTLYPDGFENLVKYVHNNGQKIGLYMIPGLSPQVYEANLPIAGTNDTCHAQDIAVQPLTQADYWGLGYKMDFSNPCAQKYIDSIAAKLHEWGVDFLKFDSVTPGSGHNDTSIDSRDDVKAWSQALKPYGIWFELSWALDINYADTWKQYANGWRVDWDVECYCQNQALTAWPNIARLFPKAEQWWRHAGPGGWNDFDSLNVGNGSMDGLTKDERQTAMTFWAISSAQLFTGNDLTRLDDYGLQLLTNDEVIAVDQAGRPAHPVSTATDQQVWYANNGDGTYTVGLFNLGSSAASVTVDWDDIGLTGPASVRDLWSHSELGQFEQGYTAENLPAHGSRLFKVTSLGGSVTINDDDTGVLYSGNWTRNGGNQLEATAQNIELDIQNAAQPNSSLSPSSAVFDKAEGQQSDVTITMDLNGNSLTEIAVKGQPLAENTDYTVSGNTVTVKSAYLASRPTGLTPLLFTFSGGSPATLAVTISDSTIRDSAVNPPTVSFDRNGKTAEIPLAIALNGNTLTGINKGGNPLVEGQDYTYSGSKVILKNEYLKAQDIGIQTLRFTFSGGAEQEVNLIIRDTAQGGVILLNNDDPSISYSGGWNRSTSRGLGDYMDDVHFAEREGDSFSYTFNGTGIEYVTEMDPSQGDVDIYIDDQFMQTVGTSNAGRLAGQVVYSINGLQDGSHTLKAVKKQNGYFMLLDQLRVLTPDLFTPTSAAYDKSSADPQGAAVTLAAVGTGVSRITSEGSELMEGTDYEVDNQNLLFLPSYLNSQELGPKVFTVTLENGAQQDLLLNIGDSQSPDSSIAPETASFDRFTSAQSDITVTLSTYGDAQLSKIINGSKPLTPEQDYVLAGNEVTLNKTYLAALPVGVTPLKFVFDKGAPQFLTLAVSDSTPENSRIYPPSASFDKSGNAAGDLAVTVTPNGNQLEQISNGDAVLEPGQDYIASGDQVLISKSYLSAQPDGMANLTFAFSSGEPQLLTIVIRDSDRGRYRSVNDDEAGIRYSGAWQYSSGRGLGDFKNDVHFTERDGDSFAFTFKGTGIELLTETDNSEGEMDIYVDGQFQQTVNAYSQTRGVHQPLFRINGLSDDEHTLKVVKKSGYYMLLDQLSYQLPDMLTPDTFAYDQEGTGQNPVEVTLAVDGGTLEGIFNGNTKLEEGTDYELNGSKVTLTESYLNRLPAGKNNLSFQFRGDYQNDLHLTAADGDSFSYTFKGTGVSLILPKGPEYGDMDVYVDNELKQTVDAYSPSRQTQQAAYTLSGIANGVHTVKVVKKSGQLLGFDGIRYLTANEPGTEPSTPNEPSPSPSPTPSPSPSPSPNPSSGPQPTPAPSNGSSGGSGSGAAPSATPLPSGTEGTGGQLDISKEDLAKADDGVVTMKVDPTTNTLLFPEDVSGVLGHNKLKLVYDAFSLELSADTLKQLEDTAETALSKNIPAAANTTARLSAESVVPAKTSVSASGAASVSASAPTSVSASGAALVSPSPAAANLKAAGKVRLSFSAVGLTPEAEATLLASSADKRTLKLEQASPIYDFQFGVQSSDRKITLLSVDRLHNAPTITFNLSNQNGASDLLGVYRLAKGQLPVYMGGTADSEHATLSTKLTSLGQYGVLLYDKTFADVPSTFWAVKAIKQMAAKQIIEGINNQLYAPEKTVTRAQFAAMITRAMKLEPSHTDSTFVDVKEADWYADAVAAVSSAGIITGKSGSRFDPEAPITREEMAVILIRALHFGQENDLTPTVTNGDSETNGNSPRSAQSFRDASQISPWAAEAIHEASLLHLIEGRQDGTLAPQAALNRAESAAVLAKLLTLSGSAQKQL